MPVCADSTLRSTRRDDPAPSYATPSGHAVFTLGRPSLGVNGGVAEDEFHSAVADLVQADDEDLHHAGHVEVDSARFAFCDCKPGMQFLASLVLDIDGHRCAHSFRV